jgi:hypothetical protein
MVPPKRLKLRVDREDPRDANDRVERDATDPTFTSPATDAALPNLANERSDNEDPHCILSTMLNADPRRAKFLNEKEEPTEAKLSTLIALDSRMKERIDTPLPILTNCTRERFPPSLARARTERELPK